MTITMRRGLATWLCLMAALFGVSSVVAAERNADGFYPTGTAVQSVEHFIFSIDVFTVTHYMSALPSAKTRRAAVDSVMRKRFVLKMLRDVDCERLRDGLAEGYARNGYKDAARQAAFLAPLACDELREGSSATVSFEPELQITSLEIPGRPVSKVVGLPFMKATWNLWFGLTDPRDMGDKLLSKI